jgi:NADPH:quinone reductase-like Zn-dependent oxidoreductase
MTIRALVVAPSAPGRLTLRAVPTAEPAPNEAVVRVQATSLNPGECRRVAREADGYRPGWDFAGVVEQAARDGTGPKGGIRVVGNRSGGSWAELVAHRADWLAPIPEQVTTEQAACLPIAGLTPLRALEQGGFLLERDVLITGASGSVGAFAIQLARLAGARVVGLVRRPERAEAALGNGAHHVAVGEDADAAREHGPFDLILDGQGGAYLATAMHLLKKDGKVVFFGTSASHEVHLDPRDFYLRGGGTLYGLALSHELSRRGPADDLARLMRLLGEGRLKLRIDAEGSWTDAGALVQQQLDRAHVGKIVMRFD